MKLRTMLLALLASLFFTPIAHAGDVNAPANSFALKAPAAPAPVPCQSSADCSGAYGVFGIASENLNVVANGITGASNNLALQGGAGYQLWKGQLLAGVQGMAGYEFAGQGVQVPGSHFTGTLLAQFGYNFFPSPQAAPTAPGQSPFSGLTLSNFWAASTPYVNLGGCYRHGILQACAGGGLQTVVASRWTTALDYLNEPSTKGQPDNQVFTLKVMYHF